MRKTRPKKNAKRMRNESRVLKKSKSRNKLSEEVNNREKNVVGFGCHRYLTDKRFNASW